MFSLLSYSVRVIVFPLSYCQIANILNRIRDHTISISQKYPVILAGRPLLYYLPLTLSTRCSVPCFPNADKSKQKKLAWAISATTTSRPHLLARFRTVQYNSLDGDCPSRLNAWIQSRKRAVV